MYFSLESVKESCASWVLFALVDTVQYVLLWTCRPRASGSKE